MTDGRGSISQLIDAAREGDSVAIARIWDRFYVRLISLARQKLRDTPRHSMDEEDVVVDAFDSFFRGVGQGRFPRLNDRGDLWQVLVMLTARKAVNQQKYLGRKKRGGDRNRTDARFATTDREEQADINQVVGSDPTPEFAAQLAEELELLLKRLDDDVLRRIALAKMEGYRNSEIAEMIGCRVRAVERKLRIIREIWSL